MGAIEEGMTSVPVSRGESPSLGVRGGVGGTASGGGGLDARQPPTTQPSVQHGRHAASKVPRGTLVSSGPDAGLVWHYGDPLREQVWMEDGSGVVDLSCLDVLHITGADRLRYLHLLTTASVESLVAGQSATAYLLDSHGRIQWGLTLVETGEEVWAWTEPGSGASLAAHLEKMKFRLDVSAQVRPDMAVVWVGSLVGPPQAMGTLRAGPVASREVLGGHHIVVRRAQVGDYVESGRPAGQWAYAALRIAVGIARVGVDTDERTIPNELGVPSAEVSVDKGCYPGQETVAKVRNLGAPPRLLVRLHLDGSGEELPESGADVVLPDTGEGAKSAGGLGSVAYHHHLGPIGLALVDRKVQDKATVFVCGVPASVETLVHVEEPAVTRSSVARLSLGRR